jgi:hypothetical protein
VGTSAKRVDSVSELRSDGQADPEGTPLIPPGTHGTRAVYDWGKALVGKNAAEYTAK